MRTFLILVIIAACAILAFTTILRDRPGRHPLANLLEAKKYLDTIPTDALIVLTPDNQPVTRFITTDKSVAQVQDALLRERRVQYRPSWGLADIEIIVVPGFLQMTPQGRWAVLAKFSLRKETVANLLAVKSSTDGCLAHRYQDNGWSDGGFVLIDPTMRSMTVDDASKCAIAGFDYLLGMPISGEVFALDSFPSPETSLVVLDYLKLCAYGGESDVSPKSRSRYGITNFPAIRCIRRNIADGIQFQTKSDTIGQK